MRNLSLPVLSLIALFLLVGGATAAGAQPCADRPGTIVCSEAGPQSGRDIDSGDGTNPVDFPVAPAPEELTLCNIHFHKFAEHKSSGYAVPAGEGEHAGFACEGYEPRSAGAAEGDYGCKGIAPGDSVEVHWVYSTCDAGPGQGLGNCVSCPEEGRSLRVEARVFTLVEEGGADFLAYDYEPGSDPAQPKALPDAPDAVVYLGSTTGPSFDDECCSPFRVTWSVARSCASLDIESLGAWCSDNVFSEDHAHGVRPLVTDPALLSPID